MDKNENVLKKHTRGKDDQLKKSLEVAFSHPLKSSEIIAFFPQVRRLDSSRKYIFTFFIRFLHFGRSVWVKRVPWWIPSILLGQKATTFTYVMSTPRFGKRIRFFSGRGEGGGNHIQRLNRRPVILRTFRLLLAHEYDAPILSSWE